MTRSPDDLPPAISSLWRTLKLGYQAEPHLLGASLAPRVIRSHRRTLPAGAMPGPSLLDPRQ